MDALWTALEVVAFALLVAGVLLLAGAAWALLAAGGLLAALVVWRAVQESGGER